MDLEQGRPECSPHGMYARCGCSPSGPESWSISLVKSAPGFQPMLLKMFSHRGRSWIVKGVEMRETLQMAFEITGSGQK